MSTKFTPDQLAQMDDNAIYQIAKNDLNIPRCGMMGAAELRNAVTAHLTQAGRLDGSAAAAGSTQTGAPVQAAVMPKGVTAIYPPYTDQFTQLVGKTLAEAKASLTEAWSIDQNARVYVNGRLVAAAEMTSVRLEPGDRVEFAKAAAEKGR